ncbi:MAG TPA: hypothetical protein VGS22_01870 [Thermoanaerobaculia bacterium]|jgi:hypothetical protein|nr:hypothetical protein [Thermoanaerobaculia bacterium]
MMKVVVLLLFLASSIAPGAAVAQLADEPVISPKLEYGTGTPSSVLNGAFLAYASGAVEGAYYYLLATDNYLAAGSWHPPGECSYFDTVTGTTRTMTEQVIGYRGDNTFGFLQSTNPAFTRFRTVSPCFDGRFGEPTEQQHRTVAYGGGSTVPVPSAGKVYEVVNRTRIRKTPTSTSPYELASTGDQWPAGDFDQIFLGAQDSLAAALAKATSSSGTCSGQANPPANQTCTPAFVWATTPLVKITDNLIDSDGQAKTFTAVPPLLAAYDATVSSLPIFAGSASLSPVMFGFMEFDAICTLWNTSTSSPVCLQGGIGPYRLAAVVVTDASTTIRPSLARLYFKKGSAWVPMNADGTFPQVPDNFAPLFAMADYSDVKYDPLAATWKLWGSEEDLTSTGGCADSFTPSKGSHLAYANLASPTYAKTALWGSRNAFGRGNPIAHYVHSAACNCTREFIFYSSTDYACYNVPAWQGGYSPFLGFEVLVRRTLDGPPN